MKVKLEKLNSYKNGKKTFLTQVKSEQNRNSKYQFFSNIGGIKKTSI